jgi:molecular chaperone GrpE
MSEEKIEKTENTCLPARQGKQKTDDNKNEDCKRKCEEIESKYKRALADYQNLLKQTAREKEEFARYANEGLILEILPVYDNLKVSLSHIGDEEKKNGWVEGIKHIVSQFKNILENIGVEEIKTVGEKFDPNTMEAVERGETDDEKKDGMVARELSTGYKLKGKVIRAARVAVYKMKHE